MGDILADDLSNDSPYFGSELPTQNKSIRIKPSHSKKSLLQKLKSQFKACKATPISHYEHTLYSLCSQYHFDLACQELTTEPIWEFHHIFHMKKKEKHLPDETRETLAKSFNRALRHNPHVYSAYKLYLEVLDLLSVLAIKWGLSNIYNILYRFQHVVTVLKVIDASELNSNYFSMETIAFALYVHEPPLNELVSKECLDYAALLQESFLDVLKHLLHVNDPYVSEAAEVDRMQTLKQPGFFKALCSRTPQVAKLKELKNKVAEFEMAYRFFEECFISDLINIHSIQHK